MKRKIEKAILLNRSLTDIYQLKRAYEMFQLMSYNEYKPWTFIYRSIENIPPEPK